MNKSYYRVNDTGNKTENKGWLQSTHQKSDGLYVLWLQSGMLYRLQRKHYFRLSSVAEYNSIPSIIIHGDIDLKQVLDLSLKAKFKFIRYTKN